MLVISSSYSCLGSYKEMILFGLTVIVIVNSLLISLSLNPCLSLLNICDAAKKYCQISNMSSLMINDGYRLVIFMLDIFDLTSFKTC